MKENSASKDVYEFVLGKINSKEWKSGEKIMSENSLATELGVSRVSVRKALDQLEGVGLIIKKRGSGVFVSKLQASDIFDTILPIISIDKIQFFDLLEFRVGFESINIEMLENTLNKNMLNKLIDINEKMIENKDNKLKFYKYDLAFHQLIAQATNNSIIKSISSLISEALLGQLATLYEKIGPDNGIHYHKLIIEALQNNDFKVASIYMKKHMIEALTSIKSIINDTEIEELSTIN